MLRNQKIQTNLCARLAETLQQRLNEELQIAARNLPVRQFFPSAQFPFILYSAGGYSDGTLRM